MQERLSASSLQWVFSALLGVTASYPQHLSCEGSPLVLNGPQSYTPEGLGRERGSQDKEKRAVGLQEGKTFTEAGCQGWSWD